MIGMEQFIKENKDLFESNGFMNLHNYKLVEFNEDECIMEAPIIEESKNPYGFAHGGFIFGLMDSCAGLFVRVASGKNAVTNNATINYLRPTLGNKLKVVSKSIKVGKKICVIEVNGYDENNKLVSTAIFNYSYIG